MAARITLILAMVGSTWHSRDRYKMRRGIANRRKIAVIQILDVPNIRRIGICAMEEPMISRAEGTVIFPSKVSGVLITLGGIHPVATIRMERYEQLIQLLQELYTRMQIRLLLRVMGLSTHTHTHHLIMKSILILANTSFMVQSKPLTQIYAFQIISTTLRKCFNNPISSKH